jgi:hypothetical protein
MQTAIKACRLSIFVAGLGAALSTSFAVDARARRAGVQSRSGTISFLRTVGDGPTKLFAVAADGRNLRRLTPNGLDVASFE